MRALFLPIIAAGVLLGGGAPENTRTYWFRVDEANGQWCGYREEADLTRDADLVMTLETAQVVVRGAKIVEIWNDNSAESGDWTVHDHYVPQGAMTRVRRAILMASDEEKVVQTFVINHGRASRRSVEFFNLSGDQKIRDSGEWRPELALKEGVAGFGLSGLISRLASGSGSQPVCAGVRQREIKMAVKSKD